MKWAEVIIVRSTGDRFMRLTSALKNLMEEVDKKHRRAHIRLYKRQGVDSDICLVLLHEGEKVGFDGSRIGLRLTAALQEFGMVNHTVWDEFNCHST
jgi:hypothetical protein